MANKEESREVKVRAVVGESADLSTALGAIRRVYARLGGQGEPMAGTVLCSNCNNQQNRQKLYDALDQSDRSYLKTGLHTPGDYVEVSHRPVECKVCGASGLLTQAGRFLMGVVDSVPKMPEKWDELERFCTDLDAWREETSEMIAGHILRMEQTIEIASQLIDEFKDHPELGPRLGALAIFRMRT